MIKINLIMLAPFHAGLEIREKTIIATVIKKGLKKYSPVMSLRSWIEVNSM